MYEKDGVIVRPVAADFMKLELIEEENDYDSDDEYERLVGRGRVYENKEEQKHSSEELHNLRRRNDINNLRKFLDGKYVFDAPSIFVQKPLA